jgi:hypothetical protein
MEKLTAIQIIEIAKQLKTVARSISDFQIDNWSNLSTEDFNKLNKSERDILLTVQDLIAQSVIVLAENSENLISKVTDITGRINNTLKQIDNINKVIEIATASVFLVSAIVSQNPAAIKLSIEGIIEKLE